MFLTKGFSTSALCRSPSLLGRLTLPRTRVRRRGTAFKFAFSDIIQISLQPTFVSTCEPPLLPPFKLARFKAALDFILVLVRSLLDSEKIIQEQLFHGYHKHEFNENRHSAQIKHLTMSEVLT